MCFTKHCSHPKSFGEQERKSTGEQNVLVQVQLRASYPKPAWVCSSCEGCWFLQLQAPEFPKETHWKCHSFNTSEPWNNLSTTPGTTLCKHHLQNHWRVTRASSGVHGATVRQKPTPKHKSLAGMIHLKIPTRFSRSEPLEQEYFCLTGTGCQG